jgi:Mce-associated membrane protein
VSSRHRLPRSNKAEGIPETAEEKTESASEAVELTEASVDQSEPDAPAEVADVAEPDTDETPDAQPPEAEPSEGSEGEPADSDPVTPKRRVDWARVFAFGVIPAIALLLALGAGYLKWQDNSVRNADTAAAESVQVAKDSTIAMLSYKPDTVEQQLNDARNLLTGEFQESYTGLINDVVIPGAKEKQITAVASVPAAASVSADTDKAVVLVFVNQTVAVGQEPPTDSTSSVRVTLERVDGRWLISEFDPV